ncbi:MAG: PTS sugar transporter subunit IIA [Deltaproteobacteria bacterium]|nr:PTS sugar transporter subunit IIA [Deltaproteobacteria bacterium]MBI2341517.1 PTS sugar transporter subunit IIA [Deltaproteobacteria bacterium]
MLEKYLNSSAILPRLKATLKEEVLAEIANSISANFKELSAAEITKALKDREQIDSTAIEGGVAIPHAKLEGLTKVIVSVARSASGIDFSSHDKKPTSLFFVILAPFNGAAEHIKLLARLAKILTVGDIKVKLLEAKNTEEIYNLLIDADKKLDE